MVPIAAPMALRDFCELVKRGLSIYPIYSALGARA